FEHVVQPLRVTVDVGDRPIEISLQVEIRAHSRFGQNLVEGARREGKMNRPVSNQQLAARSLQGDLSLQQSLSVGFLQDRKDHLVANQTGQRMPVHVEISSGRAGGSVTK